jgi:probable O-glycosylation ligase (exosortase A-associated)
MFFSHVNTKWLLFLLFLLLLSVLISDVTINSFTILNNVFGFMLWHYIIVKNVTSVEKIKGVFLVLVISHAVIIFLNPQTVLDLGTRNYIFGNPYMGDGNDFSLSICIVIPMAILLLQATQLKYSKVIYMIAICILLIAIVGMQSRGATLALGMVFFYLWWYGRQKTLGVMMIATAVLVAFLYAPPQYFERLDTLSNYAQEDSARLRIVAWKAAVNMAAAHPLTGVGSGHFPVSISMYQNEFVGNLTAHSMYFLILGELGLPGIVFLLSILLTSILRNRRLMTLARGSPDDPREAEFARLFFLLNGSMIAFCVAGAFLSVAYYPHLYVLTALCSASHLMYRRYQIESKEQNTRILNDRGRVQ